MDVLFDLPATHEPRKIPRVPVTLDARVEVMVPVNTDELLRAVRAVEQSDLPDDYLHDPKNLKHALECLAWEMAEQGDTDDIQIEGVHFVRPHKDWPLDAIADELQRPTYVPIGGGS